MNTHGFICHNCVNRFPISCIWQTAPLSDPVVAARPVSPSADLGRKERALCGMEGPEKNQRIRKTSQILTSVQEYESHWRNWKLPRDLHTLGSECLLSNSNVTALKCLETGRWNPATKKYCHKTIPSFMSPIVTNQWNRRIWIGAETDWAIDYWSVFACALSQMVTPTIIFCNLNKYIEQFRQMRLAI